MGERNGTVASEQALSVMEYRQYSGCDREGLNGEGDRHHVWELEFLERQLR